MNRHTNDPYRTPKQIQEPTPKNIFSLWAIGWLAGATFFFVLSFRFIWLGFLVRQRISGTNQFPDKIPTSVLTEHPGKGIGTAVLGLACVLIAFGWHKIRVVPENQAKRDSKN